VGGRINTSSAKPASARVDIADAAGWVSFIIRVVLPFLGQEAIVCGLRLHTVSQPFTKSIYTDLEQSSMRESPLPFGIAIP